MSAILDNPWLMVLSIFVINIVYVSCLTMRTILTLKGYRYVAAAVSVLEVVVYVIGLGLVINSLDQIQNILAYALGFAAGIIVGAKGRDGDRLVMQILTPRRFELKLMDTIKQLDSKAFVIAYEPKNIHGGFWVKGVRSKKLKAYDTDEV